MKKYIKKILLCLMSLTMFLNITSVNAYSNSEHHTIETLLEECFEGNLDVSITKNNEEYTDEFFQEYRTLYDNNEITLLKDELAENNIVISYSTKNNNSRVSTLISETFHHHYTRKVDGYTKSWCTCLYCRFSYNPDTGVITHIYDPSLTVEYDYMGAAFSPSISNISTGYSKVDRLTVRYTCSYKLTVEFFHIQDGVHFADLLDYGTCSDSFLLTP